MAQKNKSQAEVMEELESRFTVVLADDVRVTKFLRSPDFTGFSAEHAVSLSAWHGSGPSYEVVPVAVQRWAMDHPDAPSTPKQAWLEWRRWFAAQDGVSDAG